MSRTCPPRSRYGRWIVAGLGDGRWALLSKVHHCMVDGVAGTDLMTVLLDTERDPDRPSPASWTPEPQPGSVRLLADAIAEQATSPVAATERLVGALRSPRQLAPLAQDAARGMVGFAGDRASTGSLAERSARPSPSLGVGPRELSDVQRVRATLSGTVNDVVLAAITQDSANYCCRVESRSIRYCARWSRCRCAARRARELQRPRVGDLRRAPGRDCDPRRGSTRSAGRWRTSRIKAGGRGRGPDVSVRLRAADAASARGATREPLPQRSLTRDPPSPDRGSGYTSPARGCSSPFRTSRFSQVSASAVAIFSYDGALSFGIGDDYDAAPDINMLGTGIEDRLRQLVELAASGASNPDVLA